MKNFQPTAQLVADLEIIAAIMEKHNLDFYVSLDGDTHGLMTEFYLDVGRTGYKVNDDTYMTAGCGFGHYLKWYGQWAGE